MLTSETLKSVALNTESGLVKKIAEIILQMI